MSDGIGVVGVAMGLFGFAEIITNLESTEKRELVTNKVKGLWISKEQFKAAWPAVLRGTGLGSVLGILPGGGAMLSSFASYTVEKKLAKDPSQFGKGAIEGVAGPESANNAGAQTSFIPLLTLGIPENAVMAMMVGAMTIHNIQPGPQVMTSNPGLFWGLIASMWVGNFMLVVLNLPMIGMWIKLLTVPYRILYPAILLFCAIGVYTINNTNIDIVITAFFGLIGVLFMKLGCEPAPLLLGFVLGPMMEENLRRAMLLSRGDPTTFLTRPISAAMLAAAVLLVLDHRAAEHSQEARRGVRRRGGSDGGDASLGRHEAQPRDLRRRAQALRRSPIAGAAAYVDPQRVQPMKSGSERLLQAHEKIPRQELAAVRMARELQVIAGRRRGERRSRLMREQQPDRGVSGSTWIARGGIAALRGIEMMRAVIGDARHDDLRAFMLQHDVLVQQNAQPQSAQLGHPRRGTRIVFMIAGDEIGAVARGQPRHRLGVPRKLRDAAVDQVAGHGDHVGFEIVHRVDDRRNIVALDRRSDVDVADLRDREAVQSRRQIGDRHVDGTHLRAPARVDESHQRCNAGEHGNRDGARAANCASAAAAKSQPPAAHANSSATSRNTVRTSSEENAPIASNPAHARRSANGAACSCVPARLAGMRTVEIASHAPVAASAANGMSGSSRQPM